MILIITGPPASGKSTIGNRLAGAIPHCAIIDVDFLRAMIRNPHIPPWEGEAGNKQLLLGAESACLLGRQFAENGLNVVILDLLTNETTILYREAFKAVNHKLVLLMPSLETCLVRNRDRGQWLEDSEVKMLYDWEVELTDFDIKFDNSAISVDVMVEKLAKEMCA